MDIDFSFDHTSNLSITQLQKNGIRSTKELEEVFFDNDTSIFDISEVGDESPVFLAVGFSSSTNPILYVFSLGHRIVSQYARRADKTEIKKYFCGK